MQKGFRDRIFKMTESFFSSGRAGDVITRINTKPRILAFDFDGTLAPIASSPYDAILPDEIRALLGTLSDDSGSLVAVISGRMLSDLEDRVGIPSLVYFGNHGMTSSVEGLGAGDELIDRWNSEAMKIHEGICFLEELYQGCIVENKGPILSVHYRNLEPGLRRGLIEEVQKAADGSGFVVNHGKMVAEIRPASPFSKGTALAQITARRFLGWSGGNALVYLGDDRTDEDAFGFIAEAGPGAFGFKVGEGETLADFRLTEGEVIKFLKMMTGEET
jgi:trehalose-phosphatase